MSVSLVLFIIKHNALTIGTAGKARIEARRKRVKALSKSSIFQPHDREFYVFTIFGKVLDILICLIKLLNGRIIDFMVYKGNTWKDEYVLIIEIQTMISER